MFRTRTMVPCSTCGRNASCCPLLKRCISSTNKIVRRRLRRRLPSAAATTARISFTPQVTAETRRKQQRVARSTTAAKEVLPQPGGPQRIRDGRASRASSGASVSSAADCPTKSSTVCGRIRSASGADDGGAFLVAPTGAADEVRLRSSPGCCGEWCSSVAAAAEALRLLLLLCCCCSAAAVAAVLAALVLLPRAAARHWSRWSLIKLAAIAAPQHGQSQNELMRPKASRWRRLPAPAARAPPGCRPRAPRGQQQPSGYST
eukprot:COSAG05_NODE_1003_length_6237_cov_7.337732_5_plen_261_part_00